MSWPLIQMVSRGVFNSISMRAMPVKVGSRGSSVISIECEMGVTSLGRVHCGGASAVAATAVAAMDARMSERMRFGDFLAKRQRRQETERGEERELAEPKGLCGFTRRLLRVRSERCMQSMLPRRIPLA